MTRRRSYIERTPNSRQLATTKWTGTERRLPSSTLIQRIKLNELNELVESPDLNQLVVARADQQTAVGRIPMDAVHVVLVRVLHFDQQIEVRLLLFVLLEHADAVISTGGRDAVVRLRPAHTVDRVLVVAGQRTDTGPFVVQIKPDFDRLIIADTDHLGAFAVEVDRPDGGLVVVQCLEAGPVVAVFSVELNRIVVRTAGQHRLRRLPADVLHVLTVVGENAGTFVLVHADVLPDPDGLVTAAGGQKLVVGRVGDHLHLVLVALQVHVALPLLLVRFVVRRALPDADGRVETAADQLLAIVRPAQISNCSAVSFG